MILGLQQKMGSLMEKKLYVIGWQNGFETTPMTNLKLSNLHLTPNNAPRLAIQDLLCRS